MVQVLNFLIELQNNFFKQFYCLTHCLKLAIIAIRNSLTRSFTVKTQPYLELATFLNINNNLKFEVIGQETFNSNDFKGLQYSGCSLKEVTFNNVIFDSCDFYGTTFAQVHFNHCIFINCKFHFSHMNYCILNSCTFENSDVLCSTFKNSKVSESSLDSKILDHFLDQRPSIDEDQFMAA